MAEAGSAREGGDNGSHEAAGSHTPLIEVLNGEICWVGEVWEGVNDLGGIGDVIGVLHGVGIGGVVVGFLLGFLFGRTAHKRASTIDVSGFILWRLLSINCSCWRVHSIMSVCQKGVSGAGGSKETIGILAHLLWRCWFRVNGALGLSKDIQKNSNSQDQDSYRNIPWAMLT